MTAERNTDFTAMDSLCWRPPRGSLSSRQATRQTIRRAERSEFMSRGNYVVIAHGNSEFSLIPYLKAGSLKVRNGQRVKQGDVIGECGNSGSSFAPHVEYSLQNTRGFPLPKTMPAQFVDYMADGKAVPIGEPLRGQMVGNEPKAPPVETAVKP